MHLAEWRVRSAMAALLLFVAFSAGCDWRVQHDERETVVLAHGLGRSPRSMTVMARRLEAAGYRVINFGYESREHTMETLVRDLEVAVRECCGDARSVHFVTHSMGGILVRSFLASREAGYRGRVVMLSPPTRGSEVIDAFADSPLLQRFLGPSGMALGTDSASLPNVLAPPSYPVGVITGDRSINPINSWLIPGPDDGKVAVSRASLASAPFLVVHRTHPFIMNGDEVGEAVIEFLRTGSFPEEPADARQAGPEEEAVRGMSEAFNAQDVPGMLKWVADSIEWYSVQGGEIAVEARGAQALESGMTSYFEALPSARSELTTLEVLGPWVTTHELARWTVQEEERTQASVGVYEVREGRVRRVWYFPAVPCDPSGTDPSPNATPVCGG